MMVLHVKVTASGDWLVARALEEPAVITQSKTFDKLIDNVRDAAELLLQERNVHIELVIPAAVRPVRRGPRSRREATSHR